MTSVIYLRACPRCHGDMYLEVDPRFGACRSCIQCGCTRYLSRGPEGQVVWVGVPFPAQLRAGRRYTPALTPASDPDPEPVPA